MLFPSSCLECKLDVWSGSGHFETMRQPTNTKNDGSERESLVLGPITEPLCQPGTTYFHISYYVSSVTSIYFCPLQLHAFLNDIPSDPKQNRKEMLRCPIIGDMSVVHRQNHRLLLHKIMGKSQVPEPPSQHLLNGSKLWARKKYPFIIVE